MKKSKIKIEKNESIIVVKRQPEEMYKPSEVYFSARYLGRIILKDPDLGDEFNYYIIQTLDKKKILHLHPLWNEIYFRG